MKSSGGFLYFLLGIATAMIGYHMHHDLVWAVLDWVFFPIAWAKWLICQEVNLTIIKETFSFLLK